MELLEINDRIDTRLNSFEVPIEVDMYEKSIYLTRSQKAIFLELCNIFEVSGDVSEFLHPFLQEYITDYPVVSVIKQGLLPTSKYVQVPSNIYRVVLESAILQSDLAKFNNKRVKVIKVRLGEIPYKIENPFRLPDNKEIWRVTTDTNIEDNTTPTVIVHELVLPENTVLSQYSCKYLRMPPPILLETFIDISVDGETTAANTLFCDIIMEKIIDSAVMSILQDKTVFNSAKNV